MPQEFTAEEPCPGIKWIDKVRQWEAFARHEGCMYTLGMFSNLRNAIKAQTQVEAVLRRKKMSEAEIKNLIVKYGNE